MWSNPQFSANLVTFTEETLNGKLPFLYKTIKLEYTKKLISYFIVLVRNHLQISPLTFNHFSPVSHFYTPWKCQKTFGFLTFSGGIEMERINFFHLCGMSFFQAIIIKLFGQIFRITGFSSENKLHISSSSNNGQ